MANFSDNTKSTKVNIPRRSFSKSFTPFAADIEAYENREAFADDAIEEKMPDSPVQHRQPLCSPAEEAGGERSAATDFSASQVEKKVPDLPVQHRHQPCSLGEEAGGEGRAANDFSTSQLEERLPELSIGDSSASDRSESGTEPFPVDKTFPTAELRPTDAMSPCGNSRYGREERKLAVRRHAKRQVELFQHALDAKQLPTADEWFEDVPTSDRVREWVEKNTWAVPIGAEVRWMKLHENV